MIIILMTNIECMNIISWNINGLKSGFDELRELIATYSPDFVCLQKVRCNTGREQYAIDGYRSLYTSADSGGWSGVMTYARNPTGSDDTMPGSMPGRITTGLLSENGHLQVFDCDAFFLVNAYVPFSDPDLSGAIQDRKDWDTGFRRLVVELSTRKPVIICGDMNVVHTQKDTCEKYLDQSRGCFYEWERGNFSMLLNEADLVDTFRSLHPDTQAVSFYGNYRTMQKGNRIDYFLMSRALLPGLIVSEILNGFGTRQSVPIYLRFNPFVSLLSEK